MITFITREKYNGEALSLVLLRAERSESVPALFYFFYITSVQNSIVLQLPVIIIKEGKENVKKRVITCVYVLLLIVCGKLGFQYLYNEYVINQYNQENYSLNTNPLLLGNWIQPYLAHYNMGNIHYQNEKYGDAVKEYKEALGLNPGKERECSVRINLALAMIKAMGEDYDSEENVKTSIETLKEARNILLEKDCATQKGDGHSETAEELKEEIDKMIEKLEKTNKKEPDNGNNPQDQPEEKKDDDTYEKNIKENLQKQQEEAYKERAKSIESYEEYDYEFNFDSDGRVW